MQVVCPGCQSKLSAPDAAAGKSAKCPKCGKKVEIPHVQEPKTTPVASTVPPPVQLAQTTGSGTKACSYCGEEIKQAAIVCRFCGMNLMSGETTRGQAQSATPLPRVSPAQVPEKILWQDNPTHGAYLGIYILAALLILVLIGIPLLIWAILDRKHTVYTVSNKRVIQKRGIVGKDLSEVDLKDIRNVLVKYGVIDRLLGIGSVGMATARPRRYRNQYEGVQEPRTRPSDCC